MTGDASTRSSYMIWDGVAALLRTGVDGPQVLHFDRDVGWEPAGVMPPEPRSASR